ncbi:MAG: hypothetical protein M3416_07910 [Acidobacteriota bacterium]|nr:hypothetical protein [Acidobacteriota bacterium]
MSKKPPVGNVDPSERTGTSAQVDPSEGTDDAQAESTEGTESAQVDPSEDTDT